MAYEPFSESTNKIKRNLLAVSFVGVLYGLGKILPTEDAGPLLGYKIVPDFVPYAITMAVFYLIVSLMIHLADDWWNTSGGPFFENQRKLKEAKTLGLIDTIAGDLRERMDFFEDVFPPDSDICERVAHSFVHELIGAKKTPDKLLREVLSQLASAKMSPIKGALGKIFEEFMKNQMPSLVKGYVAMTELTLETVKIRGATYGKFKKARFWFEALLPMIVGVAAIILLWTGQAESSPELPQEESVETDLESRTAEEEDSGN